MSWVTRSFMAGLLVLAVGGVAMGAKPKAPKQAPPPPPRPQLDMTKIKADRQEIIDAKAAVVKAQKDLDEASAKLIEDYEKTPEFLAAKKNVDDAAAEEESARSAALEKVHADPKYKEAAAKVESAKKQLDTLREQKAPADMIGEKTTEIYKLEQAANKLEHQALETQPTYLEAEKKLAVANKALADLLAKFKDGLKTNESLAPLRQAKEDAQKKVTEAQAKLAADSRG